MIDWLTLRVDSGFVPRAGHVASFTADGEVEWAVPRRLQVEGSHSAQVSVRTVAYHPSLEISGCPAKFLQGHNVFGSDDLPGIVSAFVLAVYAKVGYIPTPGELDHLARGMVVIARIDVNYSSDFGTEPRALAAIRGLSECSHLSFRGRGSLIGEGTCTWGAKEAGRKQSRRWSMKAYAKRQELRVHKLREDLPFVTELHTFSEGLVRMEVTVRGMELKQRGLEYVAKWTKIGMTPRRLFDDLAGQLTISEATMRETPDLDKIPMKLRPCYSAWFSGADCRQLYQVRMFYRYRKALLAFGVDIAMKRPRETSNVVHLGITLRGREVGVPDWARGTSIYFEPAAQAA